MAQNIIIMKKYTLLLMLCAIVFALACSPASSGNKQLKGDWKSKDGKTKLKITGKEFILDDGAPIKEDYIVKGDTLLTSFEGNQPYTEFIIKQIDEHNLHLLFPDSVVVEFER
ncbi:hypothetical protein GCM10023149_53530 [Mucilaginibacter gynuensis]|uniref:DUF5640 domain-containing protein n=2 Tax=Mucilaginibacter gynuensis TaxID=1302236 RepID=A0ABP8HMP5_9SPHI